MKGVVKTYNGRYTAQYWNKVLKRNIYIGKFDTPEEAEYHRMLHLAKVFDGEIDDSIPKERALPKGIDERHNKYRALICFTSGFRNKHTKTIHVGTFNTIDEAVEARKQFILKLL